MHNGTIEALSAGAGKGSEFIIRLPTSKSVVTPDTDSHSRPAGGTPRKRFRILIVDDNEAAARSLGTLLEYRGHQITLAHEWRTALREASNGHAVALLDIGMPEKDGYELARLILREVASPPILIALTGYGQENDKRKAREAGFFSHLTKPVGLADIEKVLIQIPNSV